MFLHIALKDLKVVFRDRKALAIMLLMPILIMLILGTAFGSMFNNGGVNIEKFKIAVVNKDNGVMASSFVDDVLQKELSNLFDTAVVDESKADEMLKGKEVPAAILIPEGFTQGISSNKPVSMEVRVRAEDSFKTVIVKSVAENYAQGISLYNAGAVSIADIFQTAGVRIILNHSKPGPIQPSQSALSQPDWYSNPMAIMGVLRERLGNEVIKFTEDNQEKQKNLSAIQFYSASMMVMFILFGANIGINMMVEEREEKTLRRIMSTSAGKITLLTGKFLGLMLIGLTQSLILILFTKYVYKVNWGSSIAGLLLLTFCSLVASSGFGMFIAAIAKTQKAADGIGMVLIQVFTFLSGSMVPYYVMPDVLKQASKVTLNYWAVKCYHDMMLGTGIREIFSYCMVLAGMGLAYMAIGVLNFKTE